MHPHPQSQFELHGQGLAIGQAGQQGTTFWQGQGAAHGAAKLHGHGFEHGQAAKVDWVPIINTNNVPKATNVFFIINSPYYNH